MRPRARDAVFLGTMALFVFAAIGDFILSMMPGGDPSGFVFAFINLCFAIAFFVVSRANMLTRGIIPLIFLLPMLYPTGRFLSPRWRWLTIASLIVFALAGTGLGLLPDFSRSNGMDRYAVANPFGVLPLPGWWFSLFYTMFNLDFAFLNLVGVAAMVVRFRRSVGDERQQMKWLAYFLTMAIGIQMLFLIYLVLSFIPSYWKASGLP